MDVCVHAYGPHGGQADWSCVGKGRKKVEGAFSEKGSHLYPWL